MASQVDEVEAEDTSLAGKLQSTLLHKLQNTDYVDNDVDVDDVDDDEEGAGAYFFFLVRHSDGHTNCELH